MGTYYFQKHGLNILFTYAKVNYTNRTDLSKLSACRLPCLGISLVRVKTRIRTEQFLLNNEHKITRHILIFRLRLIYNL